VLLYPQRQKITPQTGCEEYLFLTDDGGKLDCITDMLGKSMLIDVTYQIQL